MAAATRWIPGRDSCGSVRRAKGRLRGGLAGGILAAFLSHGLAAGLAAQESVLPPAEFLFGEELEVRVVNLEVVVEDRRGNRVGGLGPDEFRLFVDGEPVAVDYFTEILANRAVERETGDAPPGIGGGDVVPTHYLIFVDDDHTGVAMRRPVLNGLIRDLDGLGINDEVAVVVRSRRLLETLSDFTTDREATRRALETLAVGRRFSGMLYSPQRREQLMVTGAGDEMVMAGTRVGTEVLNSVANDVANPGMAPGQLSSEVAAELRMRDLEYSIIAVNSTMRALAAPQGRKVLLLLAGAWPTASYRTQSRYTWLRPDHSLLDDLIDEANVLGYTVYPMDQQSSMQSLWHWSNLKRIAAGTGGRAYVAGANMNAMARVADDVADYYWLGFVPDYERTDTAHEVRVEVLDPRLRVRSRRGYVDRSRRAEGDMEVQRALFFPETIERTEERALHVEIGKPERSGVRKVLVPIRVLVPVGRFTVVPWQGAYVSRLELRFAVVDSNGQQGGIPLIPLVLGGGSEPAEDAVVPYEFNLRLRRKPHDLVVSVHDPLSLQTISGRALITFR